MHVCCRIATTPVTVSRLPNRVAFGGEVNCVLDDMRTWLNATYGGDAFPVATDDLDARMAAFFECVAAVVPLSCCRRVPVVPCRIA